jgi:hypothetical protein
VESAFFRVHLERGLERLSPDTVTGHSDAVMGFSSSWSAPSARLGSEMLRHGYERPVKW